MLDAQRELRGDVLLEDGASRLNCQAGDAYAHSRAYEAGSQEPGPSAGPGSPHSGLIHGFPKGIGATRPDDEFDDDNEEDCVQFKVGAIYQLIEGKRLCFVVHRDDEETLRDIRRFPKLFFFSSDLQVGNPPPRAPVQASQASSVGGTQLGSRSRVAALANSRIVGVYGRGVTGTDGRKRGHRGVPPAPPVGLPC